MAASSCSVARKSSRMVQQTQPLLIWMICSLVSLTKISESMFSSPNSFSTTAIFWPCASASTRFKSVVLPEPKKPVRMVAGIKLMGVSEFLQVGSVPANSSALAYSDWATVG